MSHPATTVNFVLFHTDPVLVNRALSALAASTPPPDRVQIHVNDDEGGSLGIRDELLTGVTVTRSSGNLGFAEGHNRLLAAAFAAGAEVVVVHNPDLMLEPAALGQLAGAVAGRTRLVGPALDQADGDGHATGRIDSRGIVWSRDGRHFDAEHGELLSCDADDRTSRRVTGISGACLVVSRSAYERVMAASGEFFDEDFIAYREDAELAIRAEVLGIESWLIPEARGLHVRTQRGTARGNDAFVDLLGVRNRFLIVAKWGRRRPGVLPLAVVRDLIVVLAVLLSERSSLPGLLLAWRLRHRMREKGRRVVAWSRAHPMPGP